MPKQQTILQIFLASPSDVSEERDIVQSVVSELNRTWASDLNVVYQVCRWEFDVSPGFDQEPQAVVNRQIPSDYDVFIGIFWGRIGTTTKNHQSGTIEEFNIALERFKEKGTPEILLYFKESPIAPSRIDPEQLGSLLAFKRSIPELGGLYSTFEDQPGFESSLRSHLAAAARKIVGSSQHNQKAISTQQGQDDSANEVVDDENDLGYLDYIDIYVDKTRVITDCLSAINLLTEGIGTQISERSEQIKSSQESPERIKFFMRRSAEDMAAYARSLDVQVDVYRNARIEAFDALSKGVSLHGEIHGKDSGLIGLQDTLRSTLNAIISSKNGILGLRNSTAELPRMIKEVNTAKRQMVKSLDAFLSEMDSTHATASVIVDAIDGLSS